MPAVLIDALFDEDTSEELARRLSENGHDVERVVNIPELGEGADDSEVRKYAEDCDRIIVTHDDDLYDEYKGTEGLLRVLWITEQQRYGPYEKVQLIENFLTTVGDAENLSELPPAIPITPAYDYDTP